MFTEHPLNPPFSPPRHFQCLSNTKQLTNYLLNDEHLREINTSNSSMKGSLIKAFATVIKGLWKGSGRVVDPSSLKGAVNR